MSRAFTKEEGPIAELVVPRAPLPAGEINYVTPRGMRALREELEQLGAERARLLPQLESPEAAAAHAALSARSVALEARIASAIVIDPATQPRDEVRFGARVTVRSEDGSTRTYRIVGVDEAEAAAGRIAFVAPLARALLGKRVGDVATVRAPQGEEELEIVAIAYERE